MTKSEVLYREAREYMPGGVNSPVRAFGQVGGSPLFIKKACGSKVIDEDDREYIDYVCSWGPGILGHAYPSVIRAVQEACSDGLTYGAPTRKEVELAKLVREAYPSMELMRLVSSGTEAVMSALRVARGYTGRPYIVKFRGCYHGHSDGLLVKAGSAVIEQAESDSLGVPKEYASCTLVANYNDPESVRDIFERYGENIAALVVEPVAANMGVVLPKPGFLPFLREITKQYGAVLIFDEVITGFRLGFGGAQAYYGVEPDMTTLGKIVGGGMPVGAYGGKREMMELVAPLGGVYQAGTLSGNPVAVTAGLETLRILKEQPEIYQRLKARGERLAQAIRLSELGKRVQVNQVGSLMSVFFTTQEVTDFDRALHSDRKEYARYFWYMLEHGIYLAPSQFEAMFLSDALSEKDLEKTICAIREYR